MADNIQVTEGTGKTVSAEDVGSNVVVQRVKPTLGAAGTAVNYSFDVGASDVGCQRVTLATQEGHLGEVGGNMAVIAASELTRPADTTAYAAGDAINNSTSAPTFVTLLTNILRVANGTGYLTKIRAMTDKKDCTTKLRLHFFNAAPTPINDNAVQTLLYANKASWLGSVDLPAMSTENASSSTAAAAVVADLRMAVNGAGGSRNLWALLETIDGFTPANAQKFYIEATCDNN